MCTCVTIRDTSECVHVSLLGIPVSVCMCHYWLYCSSMQSCSSGADGEPCHDGEEDKRE